MFFKKLLKVALGRKGITPIRKHDTDAGYDLFLTEDIVLTDKPQTIFCDIQFELPKNTFGLILPRSSASKMGIMVCTGVIDNGYRGFVAVTAYSITGDVQLYEGDRIAQFVLLPQLFYEIERVEKIDPFKTDRANRGFGSTGR